MTTGSYIQKSNVSDNAIYNFESNCIIEIREGVKERKACGKMFRNKLRAGIYSTLCNKLLWFETNRRF